MRLTWVTDTHLEFPGAEGRKEFAEDISRQKPDMLLMTGDIANALALDQFLFELHERIGVPITFVLGNHDYYRGSIDEVRQWAKGPWEGLQYAHGRLMELNRCAALVGVDGWADGKLGNPRGSNVGLADWIYIEDMLDEGIAHDIDARLDMLGRLGKEEADTLRPVLAQALARYEQVFVITHVPPWKEATWHEGFHSDDNWLPWFSCKAVGDCIEEESAKHPGRKITVLCGHTHGYGHSKITDDIDVYTGMATYYMPEVQFTIELFEDGSYDINLPINSWEAEND